MPTSGGRFARARRYSTARSSKSLWDRIKHKTTYRVSFDNEDLLEKCTRALQDAPAIPKNAASVA